MGDVKPDKLEIRLILGQDALQDHTMGICTAEEDANERVYKVNERIDGRPSWTAAKEKFGSDNSVIGLHEHVTIKLSIIFLHSHDLLGSTLCLGVHLVVIMQIGLGGIGAREDMQSGV